MAVAAGAGLLGQVTTSVDAAIWTLSRSISASQLLLCGSCPISSYTGCTAARRPARSCSDA